jgi:hypothetical protein
MRVRITQEVLNISDGNTIASLEAIFSYFMEKRHLWEIDDPEKIKQSEWFKYYHPSKAYHQKCDDLEKLYTEQILFMLSLDPRDPLDGSPLDKSRIFYEIGNQAMAYIFPGIKGELRASPGNRILLERIPGLSVKDQILSVSHGVKSQVLASHGISEEAFKALQQCHAEEFIEIRAKHLAQFERNFILNLGIPLSEEIIGETDIDTDDN